MPEEINRIVTDAISDWLFVTEPSGVENLRREGKPETAIHFVGNVMIDNLLYQRAQLETIDAGKFSLSRYKLTRRKYGVVTLHRPSNVDDAETLSGLAIALREISSYVPLVFPLHPRTRANLEKFGISLGPNVE